jgi:hypothetical protein
MKKVTPFGAVQLVAAQVVLMAFNLQQIAVKREVYKINPGIHSP